MSNVGFGIFGRPIGHKYISNGLFHELGLESTSYLNPSLVILKKGEKLIQISRHNNNNQEVISIYIYEYAESFNKRVGGFIGSAYVFTGNPTRKLLYNAIKNLHSKVFKLLDINNRFKSDDFNISIHELISINTKGLVNTPPRKITNKTFNNEKFAVYTEGYAIDSLIPIVQGFMYNPNFSTLKSLYVSDNKDLLLRILENNQKNLLGLGHVLNFENHFRNLNKKLDVKKEEYRELTKKIESKKNEKQKIERYIQQEKQKLTQIEQEINTKNQSLTGLNSEISSKLNELHRIKESVKNENKLPHPPKIENQKLEKRPEKFKEGEVNLKKKLLLLLGIVFIGFMLGTFTPSKKIVEKVKGFFHTKAANEKRESITEKKKYIGELPKKYTTKEFIELSAEQQQEHKKNLDNYIELVIDKKPNPIEYDLTSFFNREWNIGELIDVEKYEKKHALKGLERINQIKELYKEYNKSPRVFDEYFGITEKNAKNFIDTLVAFKSSRKHEMLNEYLNIPGNIYDNNLLPIENKKIKEGFDDKIHIDENRNEILIFMHFRWMIYVLSEYDTEKDKDLYSTDKKEHKVILIK